VYIELARIIIFRILGVTRAWRYAKIGFSVDAKLVILEDPTCGISIAAAAVIASRRVDPPLIDVTVSTGLSLTAHGLVRRACLSLVGGPPHPQGGKCIWPTIFVVYHAQIDDTISASVVSVEAKFGVVEAGTESLTLQRGREGGRIGEQVS